MDDIDTEQFIEEIRKRRAIWDSATEDYKNRDIKRKQWAEVSTVLYPDFVALDSGDKIRTILELQAKWKHIRDSYVRSLRLKRKSGHSRRTPKSYVYSRQLDFLRSITTSRQPECSPQAEVIIHDLDDDEDDFINEHEGEPLNGGVGVCDEEGPVDLQSSIGQPDVDERTENGQPSRKNSFSSTQRKRRRTECLEQNIQNYIDSYDRERMDRRPDDPSCDDMDFFRSLLPLIQLLPLYERMKFRMDVMRIGLEYFEKSRASGQFHE